MCERERERVRGTYKLRICMQIRVMQLFPALVANTNNQLAVHKSSCTACDHLVVLRPICISGWVISASTRFPPQAALHPLDTPHTLHPIHSTRHVCACSFGCETTMSGGAQPFATCYYVVAPSQTCERTYISLYVCVCVFTLIPCGHCHSACR